MVTGDAVNTAARLQSAAEPGGVLVARAHAAGGPRVPIRRRRRRSTSRARRTRSRGPLARRGGRRRAGRAGTPRADGRAASRELELLRTPLPPRGRPRAARISSRSTVSRVSARAADARVPRLGEANDHRAARAPRSLPPVRRRHHVLAARRDPQAPRRDRATATHPSRSSARARRCLRGRPARPGALDAGAGVPALAYTLGVEDPTHREADREPQQVRDGDARGVARPSSRLAADAPLVVVVEDIHWADPALLDLLEELADRADGPLLFICPARPDAHSIVAPDGAAAAATSRRRARPADRRGVRPPRSACSSRSTTCRRRSTLRSVERAEGNPFFLEEIVRQLIDEG